jgi:hypothetical protein
MHTLKYRHRTWQQTNTSANTTNEKRNKNCVLCCGAEGEYAWTSDMKAYPLTDRALGTGGGHVVSIDLQVNIRRFRRFRHHKCFYDVKGSALPEAVREL